MDNTALVVIQHDQPVTTSLKVAEVFKKEHKNVIKAIREILAAEKSAAKFYHESTYENRGKDYPVYYMNRDGFTLLAMGFTGQKALQFKMAYIEAFNRMEATLHALPAQNHVLDKALELARLCSTDPELLKLLQSVTKQPDVVEQPAAEEYTDTTDPDTITMESLFYDYVVPASIIKKIPKGNGRDGYSVTALYQYVCKNFRPYLTTTCSGSSGTHRKESLVQQDRVEKIIGSLIEYNTPGPNARL